MKTRVETPSNDDAVVFRSKEEYVAEHLRSGILSGEIPRGTRLKQADLAAQLGLSITPVREALKLLAAEGFVHAATHRGSLVAPFEIAAAGEIVELRALLEVRLAVTAMRRMTLGEMENFQRLAQEFERASDAGDVLGARGANYRFHRFVFRIANEPLANRFVNVLWAKYPFDILLERGGRLRQAKQEHAALIDAVVSRNEEAAAIATRQHIHSGWKELAAALAEHPAHAPSAKPRSFPSDSGPART